MAQVGISVRIDVTKIDKSRLYKGERGTYLDLTTFVDLDRKDQYENNGFITQSPTKEEREAKERMPILGNVRVFYKEDQQPVSNKPAAPAYAGDDMDDDIPF